MLTYTQGEAVDISSVPELYEPSPVLPDKGLLSKVRDGLKRNGYSHRQAAIRLGLNVNTVRVWLYGRAALKRHILNDLCRMAGVSCHP